MSVVSQSPAELRRDAKLCRRTALQLKSILYKSLDEDDYTMRRKAINNYEELAKILEHRADRLENSDNND